MNTNHIIYLLTLFLLILSCKSDKDANAIGFISDNCDCRADQNGTYSSLEECEENCIFQCIGTIKDIDGNEYEIVSIGNQCWMAENLKVSRYRNGDSIPRIKENDQWAALSSGAWCWYDNDEIYESTYGKIYNWFTVNDDRGVCPKGWRIPTAEDWNTLSQNAEEGALKEAGLDHWESPNEGATNQSGFTGLPAGNRTGEDGRFLNLGRVATWFELYKPSESKITTRDLYWDFSNLLSNVNELKQKGACIRCIRDKE